MEGAVEILSICRICLKGGEMVSIYEIQEKSLNVLISDMIVICCGIELSPDDKLPSNICPDCLINLKIAYELRLTSEQTDSILKSWYRKDIPQKEDNLVLTTSEEEPVIDVEDIPETTEIELNEELYYVSEDEAFSSQEVAIEDVTESKDVNESNKGIRSIRSSKKKLYYSCDICQKTVIKKSTFILHMRRHNNERPFICEFCQKAFVNNFELKRHTRQHTGDKPYPCKYCDKRFSDFSSRRKHHDTHTGNRPYVCKECGKSFAYSNVLQAHQLSVHSTEKKHECLHCTRKFSLAHHLKVHLKTHDKSPGGDKNSALELEGSSSNWSSRTNLVLTGSRAKRKTII